MADICHFEGDNFLLEEDAWIIAIAIVYFKVQYVTRNFYASIAFVYLFEAFIFFMNALYKHFHRYENVPAAQFIANYILAWFASSENTTFVCYESAMVALVAAPAVAVSSIALWHFGVESLVGVSYETPAVRTQHVVLWSTVVIAVAFGSIPIFASDAKEVVYRQHATFNGYEHNTSLLLVSIFCVLIASYIPYTSAQKNGIDSKAFVDAFKAYLIFSIFILFLSFFSVFFTPPLGGYHSSFIRTFLSLLILWSSCAFFSLYKIVLRFLSYWHKKRSRNPL